jgi:hypothetical protein
VHKLRELNRRVVGIGVEASTSALLPAACDEFLFYERLEGVEPRAVPKRGNRRGSSRAAAPAREVADEVETEAVASAEETDVDALVTRTLAGLARSSGGPVLASMLKRAILRKEPTFSEADHGFRTFGELLRTLAERGVVEVHQGNAPGDPEVTLPTLGGDDESSFALLRTTVDDLAAKGDVHLSGLKTQLRKHQPDFSEKRFGYGGFLQFVKAAQNRGFVEMDRDPDADDYTVRPGATTPAA